MPNVIKTRGREVAEELTSATGDDWRSEPFEDCDWVVHLVRFSDGLTLSFRVDNYSKRFVFRWSNNSEAYKKPANRSVHAPDPRRYSNGDWEKWPEITCAANKSPQRLAKDIERRLLSDAEYLHDKALEIIESYLKAENKQRCLVQHLQDAGVIVNSRSTHGPHSGDYHASGNGWSLEITAGGASDFRGYSLPEPQLLDIMRLLTEGE